MSMRPERLRQQVNALRRTARLQLTFDDGFRNTHDVIVELRRAGLPVTVFVCSGYADEGGAPLLLPELTSNDPTDLEQLRTFTWQELKELTREGVTLGAHSVTHRHLPELGDEALDHEVRESKRRVEEELDRQCHDFAYPYGEHDERVRAAVRAAGYERAFSLGTSAGKFALPRLDLYARHTPAKTLVRAARFALSRRTGRMPKRAVRTP